MDFEIGMGLAVVILIVSVGFAAAATVKTSKTKYRGSLPKSAPRKVIVPAKKATTKVIPKVAPKDIPKAATTVKKEPATSSGLPVLTAPAPTPTSGNSSDY